MNAKRPPSVPARTLTDMNRNLFRVAQTASRLAKLLRGRRRERLYEVKNSALRQLLKHACGSHVVVGVDWERYPGLLTVELPGVGALHTHEAWLGMQVDVQFRRGANAQHGCPSENRRLAAARPASARRKARSSRRRGNERSGGGTRGD